MTTRQVAHLAAIHQRYPRAWIQVEDLRRDRGRGLPAWPDWCYLPLAGAYAIVSGGGERKVSLERSLDIARIGALGAWRVSQGIYSFDADVLDGLWQTPIDGEIPEEILYRLPEWCVYIATPDSAPRAAWGRRRSRSTGTTRTSSGIRTTSAVSCGCSWTPRLPARTTFSPSFCTSGTAR